jgi:hypothetical protein
LSRQLFILKADKLILSNTFLTKCILKHSRRSVNGIN